MRRGLTLIEVLVALAIASIVFGVVFLLYRTAASTALRQNDRERSLYAPVPALAALRDDLRAMVPSQIDPSNRFHLATTKLAENRAASRLNFLFWQPDPTNRNSIWNDALHVEWTVWGADTPTASLVRITSRLTGPAGRFDTTNVWMTDVRDFSVQVYDGEKWQTTWPPEGDSSKQPEPVSARITLEHGDGATPRIATDYPLPTGLVITSSTPRAANVGGSTPQRR